MAYDNLADKRANLLTQAQAIATDLAEKGGVLEGDAKQQFDGLIAEAGTIAEAIRSEKAATEARSRRSHWASQHIRCCPHPDDLGRRPF